LIDWSDRQRLLGGEASGPGHPAVRADLHRPFPCVGQGPSDLGTSAGQPRRSGSTTRV